MIRFAIGATAAALLGAVGGAGAAPITLLTEEYAPFASLDKASGKTVGIATDIVNELLARAGVAATPTRLLPWARAMATTIATPNACLYTTARTAEREALFQWIGPIGHSDWVLFARSADKLTLRTLDDARPYKIGGYIGDASVAYLKARNFTLDVASSDRANPPKLRLRRIDLWAVGRLSGLSLLREMGVGDVEPVFSLIKADMYLSCHPGMDKADVARLNEVLRMMYRDGTIQAIYTRYGYGKDAPSAEPGK